MPKKGFKKGKKKGKKGHKKSNRGKKASASADTGSAVNDVSTRLQPSAHYQELIKVLTTHTVDEKELHNMRITTRALARLTPQEIRDLRYVFDLFSSTTRGSIAPVGSSKSGSGKTTDADASNPDESAKALMHVLDVRKALRVLGFNLTMDQVRAHVSDSALDTLPPDQADFNTFLDIVIDLQSNAPDYYDDLVRGFEKLDIEKRGRVSVEDLKGICEKLRLDFTDGELTDMIQAADTNGDGYVDLNEFIAVMRKTHLFL